MSDGRDNDGAGVWLDGRKYSIAGNIQEVGEVNSVWAGGGNDIQGVSKMTVAGIVCGKAVGEK